MFGVPAIPVSVLIQQPLLHLFIRGALIPRAMGAVTGLSVMYFGLTLLVGASPPFALLFSVTCTVLLYVCGNYNLLTFQRSLSWTRGIVSCVIGFGAAGIALEISVGEWTYLMAIFINSSYVFAKISCANLGCCGITNINDKQFYNWPMRPRLQSFEVVISTILLYLGAFLSFISLALAAAVVITCHASLRVFSARFRFPYRQPASFVFEFGTGALSLLFVALLILDAAI